MSDLRIKYLKYVEGQPLHFSAISTGILCALSVCGLLVEKGKSCKPDLRLWLIVVIVRSAIRLLCRLYVAWMMTDAMILRGDIHGSSKFVDILDVFGIVWFAVGNLLVFNNFDCVAVSPIVFFSSLSYIVFSYVSFFLPSILRCTLGICRPTAEEDLAYLRQTADADRDPTLVRVRAMNAARGTEGAGGPNTAYSPDLTPERAQYWADWLQTYGCFAVSYDPSMNLKDKQGGPSASSAPPASSGAAAAGGEVELTSLAQVSVQDAYTAGDDLESGGNLGARQREYVQVVTHSDDAGGGGGDLFQDEEGDFCSVCLLAFEPRAPGARPAGASSSGAAAEEDNNIIVRYPCRGNHYFHAHCLHSWLQVASARYLASRRALQALDPGDHRLQVTCPCCREHPVAVDGAAVGRGAGGAGSAAVEASRMERGDAPPRSNVYELIASNNNMFAVAAARR
jgi:hypothetical protein